MSSDDEESAAGALRELARWVIRDGVDSDHLEDYVAALLGGNLIELHASCRYEAIILSRTFTGHCPRDVADQLCATASELERDPSKVALSHPVQSRQYSSDPGASGPRVRCTQPRVSKTQEYQCAPPWLPEIIAAFVFTGLFVLCLFSDSSDTSLWLTDAAGFGCLGFIYFHSDD
jgi:hypothetical protein